MAATVNIANVARRSDVANAGKIVSRTPNARTNENIAAQAHEELKGLIDQQPAGGS